MRLPAAIASLTGGRCFHGRGGAVEDGALGSNPATGVRYVPSAEAKRAHPTRKHRELTAADVVAILGAMPEEWRAFFTLLAQTGVRIGELLGLTRAQAGATRGGDRGADGHGDSAPAREGH